jgi:TolB-like protein/Tfp pilus assembly protein PilF
MTRSHGTPSKHSPAEGEHSGAHDAARHASDESDHSAQATDAVLETASLATLPSSLLQSEVARIAQSAAFRTSPRHRRFLEYLVAHAMRGDGSRLKEMTLGIEVFDRNASSFDPQQDTIVRVEARRLRARLARYYREEGSDSLIEIGLPIGSYTPMLQRRADAMQLASLAILPVVDRSGVTTALAFCDDVFDALIDAVARVPGFKVIARASAIRAVATTGEQDAQASEGVLASQLGVALLLHGTLDRDENVLRLKLRLVRGTDDKRLWTGSWTLAIESGFAARDAVVVNVVEDVQGALLARPTQANLARDSKDPQLSNLFVKDPVDESARDLVDRGRYLMRHGTVDAYPQALQRFRAAAAIAPRYAAAHFGIARSLSYLLGMTQIAPNEGVEEARAAAREALALDPRHGDAASLLAAIQQRFDHDWQAAQAGYLAAIALAPGSLYVHFNYAFGLMFSGRFDEAEAELKLSRELDPLDIGQRSTQALLMIYRGDLTRAESVLAALLDDEPRHLLAHSLRGAVHLYRDEPELALAEYRIAHELLPEISIGRVGIAQAHAMAGRRAEAESERAALVSAFKGCYLSPYQLALIDLRLDRLDDAIDELDQSALQRDPNFIAVLVDPSLDVLRGNPRFTALLRRHNLHDVRPVSVDA